MDADRFHVGTDVGGTFTDLWAIAGDGRQVVVKTPTTPDIITGIRDVIALAAARFELDTGKFCAAVERFGHGTTAGLNALLTGRAARAVVITAVKLVDQDGVRQDVLDMILTATRLPAALGLDIRAFIATLNILAERAVDHLATTALRARLRSDRLGYAADGPAEETGGLALGPGLRLIRRDDGVAEVRTVGGAVLCTGSTRWRAGALGRRVDPEPYGITLHDDLAMTAWYCPRSGIQLAVDVHRRDQEPFDDLDLEVA